MFQRAVELEPNFARAYCKLSMAHSRMYSFVLYDRSKERLVEAKKAADRALEIQPDLPEAHTAMGYYFYWGFRNYDQAVKEFSIAVKTDPSDIQALVGLAAIQKRRGDFDSALKALRQLMESDPRNAQIAVELGIINHAIGLHAEGQRYLDLAISLAPDNSGTYEFKADGYLKWKGDIQVAREIINKIPDENKRNYKLYFIKFFERKYQSALDLLPIPNRQKFENALLAANCYRLMHKKAEAYASYDTARIELEKLLQKSPETPVFHSWMADAYTGLNRKQDAIREAKIGVELLPLSKDAITGPDRLRDLAKIYALTGEQEAALDQIEYVLSIPSGIPGLSVPLLRIDPAWDSLRDHPRFQRVLARASERILP
jgi:tetratricopeptide (TPR) repeat protein